MEDVTITLTPEEAERLFVMITEIWLGKTAAYRSANIVLARAIHKFMQATPRFQDNAVGIAPEDLQ